MVVCYYYYYYYCYYYYYYYYYFIFTANLMDNFLLNQRMRPLVNHPVRKRHKVVVIKHETIPLTHYYIAINVPSR